MEKKEVLANRKTKKFKKRERENTSSHISSAQGTRRQLYHFFFKGKKGRD